MRSHKTGLMVLVAFVLVHLPMGTYAKIGNLNVSRGEGPVQIEADTILYNREENSYEVQGNVSVVRGDLTLKADHARVNMATKDLTSWGNVVLREGEDVLECERVEVNLDSRLGKITQAKLFLKDQNYHITGNEVEKLGENRYRLRDGAFTTCDGDSPEWKFTVKEMEVTLAGYGVAKEPVFYLKGIPVFYLPLAYFPVKKERQSGILLPQVSYSNQYGPEVRTAFYWAMTGNMDSTLFLDYLGDRGFKEGLEYRYAFARETKGRASFYFIDDHVFDGKRFGVFVEHEQTFPYGLYMKADLNHVSDDQYVRDFDEDLRGATKIDSRSQKQLRSTVFGGKNWDQFSLLLDGKYFNDLTTSQDESTVQILPELRFYAHPQSLFNLPVFFDFSTSGTNFWREQGVKVDRWDLYPHLALPVRVLDGLKLEPKVGVRETLYRSYDAPAGVADQNESRTIFDAGVDLSTEFYRVYGGDQFPWLANLLKISKWLHTVEPLLSYHYNNDVNQDDLPFFDEMDRITYVNEITYGFTQRLVGKPVREGVETGPREAAKLKISQGYSIGDPYLDPDGKERDFSNIKGQLWLRFNPFLAFYGDAEMSPYDGSFPKINGLITLKDLRNDGLQVEYRNTKDSVRALNLYGRVRVFDPLFLGGGFRYNLLEKSGVESFYGVRYEDPCWTLGLTVNYINASPDGTQQSEWKVNVFFNLLGIGSVGHKSYFNEF
jgi:LPS-assembly protein